MKQRRYIITKRIAKQGNKSVICLPALLQEELKPSMVVKLTIDVIKEADR